MAGSTRKRRKSPRQASPDDGSAVAEAGRPAQSAIEPEPDQASPPVEPVPPAPPTAGATTIALRPIVLARLARDAALGVSGVVEVGSPLVRTYGRLGEMVHGVAVRQTEGDLTVEIHLTVRPVPLQTLAERVREAVAGALPPLPLVPTIDVCVDALEDGT